MNMTIPRYTHVRNYWIGLVMALVTAGVVALNPVPGLAATTEAAAVACRLAPRLHVGDAVTLVKGQPNRIRQAPGLAAARTAFRISAGEVWYVLAGPVCQDGMNWFQVGQGDAVGWTSEGTPAEGYYLGRIDEVPAVGGQVCASERLAAGLQVMVGDSQRQQVRAGARKSAARVAWLSPRVPVTITDGPRCADGWVWWYVSNANGTVKGWTSEGDGPNIWLVPMLAPPSPSELERPRLNGAIQVNSTRLFTSRFSGDNKAVTIGFDDFYLTTLGHGADLARRETITLFVHSGATGYLANPTLRAYLSCDPGSLAEVTVQVGRTSQTQTCENATEVVLVADAKLPANTDLRISITAHVRRSTPRAEASVFVDILDLHVTP